jgi:hypothetical protein
MIRSASTESYKKIQDSGIGLTQEKLILDFMDKFHTAPSNWTLKELSRALRMEINAVSGRVNGLKKRGAVSECTKRPCRITGRLVTPVRVRDW